MQNCDFDFEKVAGRYDLCNHLFSAGLDRRWRTTVVKTLNPQKGERILDLCCGTGDLALALSQYQPAAEIVGLDISPAMIKQARKKHTRLPGRIDWQVADAVQTGLPPQTFDLITCAFGLRNIPDRLAALREMQRLLRPEGQISILEFSLPQNTLLRQLYWLYLRYLMPAAGTLLFASRKPLVYLAESIRTWNDELDLSKICPQAGLVYTSAQPLSGGIVTLHLLQKIRRSENSAPAHCRHDEIIS